MNVLPILVCYFVNFVSLINLDHANALRSPAKVCSNQIMIKAYYVRISHTLWGSGLNKNVIRVLSYCNA